MVVKNKNGPSFHSNINIEFIRWFLKFSRIGKKYDGQYLPSTLLFDWDQIPNTEPISFVYEIRGYELSHFEDSCLKNESF